MNEELVSEEVEKCLILLDQYDIMKPMEMMHYL